MCNCIKNLEKDLVGKIINRKKVVKAQLGGNFITFGPENKETNSEMELTLEGQKKKVVKPIAHFYCPICGQKYPEHGQYKNIPA
jgi:hypothetical protein